MGVGSRLRDIRPPLPAPTDSMDEEGTSGIDTDVATTLTTRTDLSSYELPHDGSPITIPTQRIASKKEGVAVGHKSHNSTSLLIEYFESSATGDKAKSKPTVRVKVSQGGKRRSGSGAHDAVQITGIGSDRKPSYTRRISLGSSKRAEVDRDSTEIATELESSPNHSSNRRPIEVELLNNAASDVSTRSRGLVYNPVESNVSSMPPDSMLEGNEGRRQERSRSSGADDDVTVKDGRYLRQPEEDGSRSRSTERIAQKVMEKLNRPSSGPLQSGKSRSERSLGRKYDDVDYAKGSDVSNNPKLLGLVQDTIKNYILPEIQAAKGEQRSSRTPRSAESSRRSSLLDEGIVRRVSKSSSSPNISRKPKVVLNKLDDDPGTVLSRGDSERRMRKSSGGSYSEERPKSRRSNTSLREAGAASRGAGILTAANLEMHDYEDDVHERRRKRKSKSRGSRSRSTGVTETGKDHPPGIGEVPPLPLTGATEESELTRDSLKSTERGTSRSSGEPRTRAVQESSQGSLGGVASQSPTSRTPTRSPNTRNLGMSRENVALQSPKSPGGISTKDRMAALAAAGLGGAALAKGAEEVYRSHVDTDGYGVTPSGVGYIHVSSPVQSVSSLRKTFEEDGTGPVDSQSRDDGSRSPAGREQQRASQRSLHTGTSSPLVRSARKSPQTAGGAEEFARSPGALSQGDSVEDFYEQGHRLNEQYRQSYASNGANPDSYHATNRDSYQTNPYPQDEKRWTMFTDDSRGDPTTSVSGEQDLHNVGANPEFVHSPHGAESAVASLMDPSIVSSGSPTKASYGDRMSAHLREMGKHTPPMYQGSTVSQTMPSQDRWLALKEHARSASGSTSRVDVRGVQQSPRQSPAGSPGHSIERKPLFGASGLPLADDPLPEIGHFDDSKSEASTAPSIVKGPLGGDATGKDTWPYTPDPASPAPREVSSKDSRSLKSGRSTDDEAMLAAAAAGSAALATTFAQRKTTAERDVDDRSLTPDVGRGERSRGERADSASSSPSRVDDFAADSLARSAGTLTPLAEQKHYSKADVAEFNRVMDAQDVDERDDPFTASAKSKRARHISANSHGMASPIYDSATGKGKDHIQSKDIVALMDHLTVRDAQRSARDTEILVTLVRSAAEMRQSLDEMKRFIIEQDRMIMQRSTESTPQRPVGARSSPTVAAAQSQEEIQTKRTGVLRRALRGLTGGKSANDLAKFEGMLMEILANVEDLKHQSGGPRDPPPPANPDDSLDEYERLRSASDPAYEPETAGSASSTPRQSAQHISFTPRAEKHQFHSGYDGRRGSVNRVSTVMEGDEDESDLGRNSRHDYQFEDPERLLTPTQEAYTRRGLSPSEEAPQRGAAYNTSQEDTTPRSAGRQRKHQSNSSSLFGAKISRWSKTTTSSAAPDPAYLDSPRAVPRSHKTASEASRSGSTLAKYPEEDYELNADDRLRSTPSLVRDQQQTETRSLSQGSKITRTPSPLVPSETSARQRAEYEYARGTSPVQEDLDPEFDDPKYQAVRNSLLLQHPQPRQGPTGRHQNTLESQAHDFDAESATNSDLSHKSASDFDPALWGSSGTAGLAKHRLSQFEPLSPVSMTSAAGQARGLTSTADQHDSLVPQVKTYAAPPSAAYEDAADAEYDAAWEPQYSNSGFSRSGYYSSPFGSGHLLEPIEEVRYSLETESGHISPEPEVASARAISMRSAARKITGPRPMAGSSGARASSSGEQARPVGPSSGTVRRKPVSTY